MNTPDYLEKKIKTDKKIDIYYNLLGFTKQETKMKKEILVFLHGLGGDLAAWDDIREKFLKLGYKSIAIDLRGHGYSSRPRKNIDYDFKLLASDVAKIIEKEDISDVILVGHCLGGMIAQEVIITNNQRIKKAVLIATSCKPFVLAKKFNISVLIFNFIKVFENFLLRPYKKGRINHRKYFGSGDFNIKRVANDLVNTSVNSYSHISSRVQIFDISKELSTLDKEVLIIVGSKDKIFSKESSKLINKQIRNSKLSVLDEADHMIIFNYLDEIVEYINSFIKK